MRNNAITWDELRRRTADLNGHIVEIFMWLSHAPVPRHQCFIRGILTGLEWKNGRVSKVRFKDAERYEVYGRKRTWSPYLGTTFICDRRPRSYMRITDGKHPGREQAWAHNDALTFRSLDDSNIAILMKPGQLVRQRPYLYRDAKSERAAFARLFRGVVRAIETMD